MAAYITFNDGTEQEWHVGKGISLDAADVTEFQADGHELEHVENKFSNIPKVTNGRVVVWYGDMARFIVGNL